MILAEGAAKEVYNVAQRAVESQHVPPKLPDRPTPGWNHVPISEFVQIMMLRKEQGLETPLLSDSPSGVAFRCTKIEYRDAFNGKTTVYDNVYICFTDKRTLILDASSIHAFGNLRDKDATVHESSMLMNDINSSNFDQVNQAREADARKVLASRKLGEGAITRDHGLAVVREHYFFEVLTDSRDYYFVLQPENVKQVRLDFKHY